VKAIDVHVHPGTAEDAAGHAMGDARRAFRLPDPPQTVADLAEEYRALDVMGVLLAWAGRVSNERVAEIVREFPSQFVGFASVDPSRGAEAVREVERAVRGLGLKGLKLHPIAQSFYPDDPQHFPLWEKCAELGVPVMFHTGHTAYGAGAPGGRGLRLKYARPILLDDVAAEFPSLTIIAAHPGWPWSDELVSVALHKGNVWIDLSGWSPKHLPEALLRHANGALQDRVLFGSDHPFIGPARWMSDFEAAPFTPGARPKILLENARRLLRL